MKTMKLKLFRCDICERPMILYGMEMDSNAEPSQGPKTAPWVKSWCGGHCDSITLPLVLEIDSLYRLARKARAKGVRALAREMCKRLKRIEAGQRKTLKEAASAGHLS